MLKVESLSKKYIIRHQSDGRYVALRDVLTDGARKLFGMGRRTLAGDAGGGGAENGFEEFWALNDVSFEVKPGERVGIIGRNGAGKSTLLKVVSRITLPTKGRVKLKGRVASLLEVGTGFHPELTGRENIYLNGAILGMTKADIKKNFDQIVAFAEVEKFLDTPVKRYSSGMYVRLAFAVAAFLEPEILIVDEVLAVGDASFQKKCLGRMEEVANEGRTILFVSHNMGAVATLCTRGVVLNKGSVVADKPIDKAIAHYVSSIHLPEQIVVHLTKKADVPIYFQRIALRNLDGEMVSNVELGQDAVVEAFLEVQEKLSSINLAMELSRNGIPLLFSHHDDIEGGSGIFLGKCDSPGIYKVNIHLPLSKFKEGSYSVHLKIGWGQTNLTDPRSQISFDILNNSLDTTLKGFRADRPGHLFLPLKWDIVKSGVSQSVDGQ